MRSATADVRHCTRNIHALWRRSMQSISRCCESGGSILRRQGLRARTHWPLLPPGMLGMITAVQALTLALGQLVQVQPHKEQESGLAHVRGARLEVCQMGVLLLSILRILHERVCCCGVCCQAAWLLVLICIRAAHV